MKIEETLKDIYYEVRIGTAMLVFLIITNTIILAIILFAAIYLLDSVSDDWYNDAFPKGEDQNVQVP